MRNHYISVADSRSSLSELWHARYLIRQLVIRDFTVRYRQSLLGWLWAFVNPALNMLLYYTVFGLMVHMQPPEYQVPYSWVLLSGLILWMLFSATINTVSDTLLNNQHLIKKIYFPRVALTIAATGTGTIDFLLALGWMFGLMFYQHNGLRWASITMGLLCGCLMLLCGWGLGCLLAVMRQRFRDLHHLTPLLIQALFYLTPVVWTPAMLPVRYNKWLSLNPLSGIIGLFRFAILHGPAPDNTMLICGIGESLLLALVGYHCFVSNEAKVIDLQ